jgi:hypothetical protein
MIVDPEPPPVLIPVYPAAVILAWTALSAASVE